MTWSSRVTESLPTDRMFPLVVEPRRLADIVETVRHYPEEVKAAVATYGAVLFRGFAIADETMLANLIETLWAHPIPYVYRSTPRTTVSKGIYTATEYPAELEIPMHCENAYQRDWPTRIGFHCVVPPRLGGQTPLADVERVTAKIDAAVVAEFREREVCYVRNYLDFIDLPWPVVFQTERRAEVEEYCRSHDINFEWTLDGLMTQQVCHGTAIHPDRGNELWFNQAQLFHISSLGADMAANLINLFGERGLPRNAYFGDGAKIPDGVISQVRNAFESEKVVFDWRKHDVLILDNMRIAHGRKSYVGERRVLVSMGFLYSTVCQGASIDAKV
jgi:alpha-ketoglutarate-dependent taurine dioxygenase